MKEQLEKKTRIHFLEMAVHCKNEDRYGIIVTIGSSIKDNDSSGSKKEHNPPHAHVWSSDLKFQSRFQLLSKTAPQSVEELQKVDESDSDFGKYGKKIVEWANAEPIRSIHKGNKTNWDAMRDSWKDIQDIVNEGLKHKVYLN